MLHYSNDNKRFILFNWVMGTITEYLIQQYFSLVYTSATEKIWSKSVNLALALARISGTKKEVDNLLNIYHNTSDQVKIPLAILEDIYERPLNKASMMKRTKIGNKEIETQEIISRLSDAYVKTTNIVTQICKRTGVKINFNYSKYGAVVK